MNYSNKMSQVLIFYHFRSLRRYVSTYLSCQQPFKFFSLSFNSDIQKWLLENKGTQIPFIPLSQRSHEEKDQFLKAYVDLIGQIGIELNSITWWASDISSKNRINSKLPMVLYEFLFILQSIKQLKSFPLLIYSPSSQILEDLKVNLKERDISMWSESPPLLEKFKHVWGGLKWFGYRFMQTILIMVKTTYAQRSLCSIYGRIRDKKSSFYLIRSFIYIHSFSEAGYRDQFFGSLVPYLIRNGQNVFIIGKILGSYRKGIKKIRTFSDFPLFPYEYFLTYRSIIFEFFRSMHRPKIKKKHAFLQYQVKEVVNQEFIRTFNGYIQLEQILHYQAFKNLLKGVGCHTYLYPFENNAWEKMCVMAMRESSPQTFMIAYHHNAVPQASANLFISEKEKEIIPLANKIFTVGPEAYRIIKKYGACDERLFENCAFRFEAWREHPLSNRRPIKKLLVALEGLKESYRLAVYVLQSLAPYSQYEVIIRTHPDPTFHWKNLKRLIPKELRNLKNYRISENSPLLQDMMEADVLIYWGSSVVVEAVWVGKPVIHFEMNLGLSYDPLFACSDFKWQVTENDSLPNLLETIDHLSNIESNGLRKKARDYLENYIFPVSDEAMSKFIISR